MEIAWLTLQGGHQLIESKHPLAPTVNMLVYSPDGKRVANTVADKTVRIWDVATGCQLLVLDVHDQEDEVVRLAFSPDGRRLATIGPPRFGMH